ncbi:alpha/beta fold hydrolase [Blastomonas sp. SL216]|uniref:alpha/beta fold hydrolase n=1 Tax=Blastomonas sp. SL216 TaxID=2995169 RepID=UPI0023775B9D|nr:alpha/beta hydrolase [Blastomonas sp. SL216]
MRTAGKVSGVAWIASGEARPSVPSLMLIHGAGGNSSGWWQQFERFAPARHVIALDLPGFGLSDPPPADVGIADTLARGVINVLAEQQVQRADLVCQSLGGWAGVRAAMARPDLISSLVLCCTLAGIDHPPGVEAFRSAAKQMDTRGPAALGLQPAFEAAYPAKARLYRQIGAANPPPDPAWGAQLFARDALVRPDQLADLTMPVTLIMGENDPIWPPASLAGMLAPARAREIILPAAGHSPYFEHPDAFNAVLAEVLGIGAS